jgi:hypothetical protein
MPARDRVATAAAPSAAAAAASGLREPCAGDQRQCQQNRNRSPHLSLLTAENPHEKV